MPSSFGLAELLLLVAVAGIVIWLYRTRTPGGTSHAPVPAQRPGPPSPGAVAPSVRAVYAEMETPPPPVANPLVQTVVIQRSPVTAGEVLSRLVWGLALVIIGFAGIDGLFSINSAESAPQQAAAAGMACFYVIVPYVVARGLQALLVGTRVS